MESSLQLAPRAPPALHGGGRLRRRRAGRPEVCVAGVRCGLAASAARVEALSLTPLAQHPHPLSSGEVRARRGVRPPAPALTQPSSRTVSGEHLLLSQIPGGPDGQPPTLVCDGASLSFWLQGERTNFGKGSSLEVSAGHLGGEYLELAEKTRRARRPSSRPPPRSQPLPRRFARSLRRSGVRLTCIFDPARLTAPESARKLASWASRVQHATLAVGELHTFVTSGVASALALHNTPPPELAMEQVKRTLQEEGVLCEVSLAAEADDALVWQVRSGAAYAVLSADSDFAVAEGCRMVPLNLLNLDSFLAAGADSARADHEAAQLRVWLFEPTRVAAALGLAGVRQLIDVCCLVGQDSTAELVARLDILPRLSVNTSTDLPAVQHVAAALLALPEQLSLSTALPELVGMAPADADAWRVALSSALSFYLVDAGAGSSEQGGGGAEWVNHLPAGVAAVAARTREDTLPSWALSLCAHRRVWLPGGVPYERPWGDDPGGGSSLAHLPLRQRLYARLLHSTGSVCDLETVIEFGWDGRHWGSGMKESEMTVPTDLTAAGLPPLGQLSPAEAEAAAAGLLPGAQWADMRALLCPGGDRDGLAFERGDRVDSALQLPQEEAWVALVLRYLFSLKRTAGGAATVRRLNAWQAEACVAQLAAALELQTRIAEGKTNPPGPAVWETPAWRSLEVSSLLQSCITFGYAAADVAGPPGVRRSAPSPAALFSGLSFKGLWAAAEAAARRKPPAEALSEWASEAGPGWWRGFLVPEAAQLAKRLLSASLDGLVGGPSFLFDSSAVDADVEELSAVDEMLQRWAAVALRSAPLPGGGRSLLDSPGGEGESEETEDVGLDFARLALSANSTRASWDAEAQARRGGEEEEESLPTSLPVEEHLPALLELTRQHRVVCFSGETGCGKSTMVPIALLRAAEADARARNDPRPCLVIVTQPRRIAAISLAQRVASTLGEQVGETVGFAIGNDFVASTATKLLFVTTGWLLRMAASPGAGEEAKGDGVGKGKGRRDVLQRTSHLVLDEAHDRSLDADFLSLLLKRRMLATQAAVRMPQMVVMSATLQGDLFRDYFVHPDSLPPADGIEGEAEGGGAADTVHHLPPPPSQRPPRPPYFSRTMTAAIASGDEAPPAPPTPSLPPALIPHAPPPPPMHVGVRRFPVREVYLDELRSVGVTRQSLLFDAASECRDVEGVLAEKSRRKARASKRLLDVAVLLAMHLAQPGQTTLVFLPGSAEIEVARLAMAGRGQGRAPIQVFALHSLLPAEMQADALARPPPDVARILLATDIAESSLTLPDVTLVIDACLRRGSQWNEAKAMTSLVTTYASQASCRQRAGRAGRVQPGTVIRLLSRASFAKLQPHDEPEMLRCSLDDVILRAKYLLAAESAAQGVGHLLGGALSPPRVEDIDSSILRLSQSGCLRNDAGGELSPLGRFTASISRLRVPVARALLLGCALGHPAESVLLAAALCLDTPPFKQVLPIFAASPQGLCDDVVANVRFRAEADGGRASDPLAWARLYSQWAGVDRTLYDAKAWRRMLPQLNQKSMRAFSSTVRGLARDLPRALRAAGVDLSPQQLASLVRLTSSSPRGGGGGGGRRGEDFEESFEDEAAEAEAQLDLPPPAPERLLRFLAVTAAGQNVLVGKRRGRFSPECISALEKGGVKDWRSAVALVTPEALLGPDEGHSFLRQALNLAVSGGGGRGSGGREWEEGGIRSFRTGPLHAAEPVKNLSMLTYSRDNNGGGVGSGGGGAQGGGGGKDGARRAGGATAQLESALFVTFRKDVSIPEREGEPPLLCDDVTLPAKYLLSLGTGRASSPIPLNGRLPPGGAPPARPSESGPLSPNAAAVIASNGGPGMADGVAAVLCRVPFPIAWTWLFGTPKVRTPKTTSSEAAAAAVAADAADADPSKAAEAARPPSGPLPKVDLAWTSALFAVSESPASLSRREGGHSSRRYAAAGDLMLMEDSRLVARTLTLLPTEGVEAELWLLALADAGRRCVVTLSRLSDAAGAFSSASLEEEEEEAGLGKGERSARVAVTQMQLGIGGVSAASAPPMLFRPSFLIKSDWEAVNGLRAALCACVSGGETGALGGAMARFLDVCERSAQREGWEKRERQCGSRVEQVEVQFAEGEGPWPPFDLSFFDAQAEEADT